MAGKRKPRKVAGGKKRAQQLRHQVEGLVKGSAPAPKHESPAAFVHRRMAELEATESQPLTAAAASPGGSILQRLIRLIGKVGIIVTEQTQWRKDLGYDDDSLDSFARGDVSEEFGKPFDGDDAGTTVGDLVQAIRRAVGA